MTDFEEMYKKALSYNKPRKSHVQIFREEIVDYGTCEYFEIETWGQLKFMPQKALSVIAHFGSFSRTTEGTLLYQDFVIRDENESEAELLNGYDSMYLDDLNALKSGNVEIVEWRQ